MARYCNAPCCRTEMPPCPIPPSGPARPQVRHRRAVVIVAAGSGMQAFSAPGAGPPARHAQEDGMTLPHPEPDFHACNA